MADVVTLSAGVNATKSAFLETPTAKGIMSVLRHCHEEITMGMVTGEPGLGKTTALRRYVRTSSQPAYCTTMSPASKDLIPCLSRIGEEIGAAAHSSRGAAWSEALRWRIDRHTSPPLIILDEAQHLGPDAIEEVRAIFDDVKCGLVLVGSREMRLKWRGRGWGQLTSRITYNLDLEAPMPEDIAAICESYFVSSKRARDLLTKEAAGPGGLRIVVKILEMAERLAGGRPMELQHIQDAARSRGAI